MEVRNVLNILFMCLYIIHSQLFVGITIGILKSGFTIF